MEHPSLYYTAFSIIDPTLDIYLKNIVGMTMIKATVAIKSNITKKTLTHYLLVGCILKNNLFSSGPNKR